jgi:diguanylate cyclase (GGDEF)-like protein
MALLLAVDDSFTSLEDLSVHLGDIHEVVEVKSGHDCIQFCRMRTPDLVLLDVEMPVQDGFETIRILKGIPEMQMVPVIFLTSSSDTETESRGFDEGAADFIAKPFNPVVLRARVETHLKVREQYQTIRQLSMLDPLTNIPNRRFFYERLEAEWFRMAREKNDLSFLMMDIDHFKNYNDTYGHSQGDEALKAVATVLRTTLKRAGDFVVRMGGEEFGALLPATDLEGAKSVAETLRQNVQGLRVPLIEGNTHEAPPITISLGIAATVPDPVVPYDRIIQTADHKLYDAKNKGRNRCEF